jgi:hypothetical protein
MLKLSASRLHQLIVIDVRLLKERLKVDAGHATVAAADH